MSNLTIEEAEVELDRMNKALSDVVLTCKCQKVAVLVSAHIAGILVGSYPQPEKALKYFMNVFKSEVEHVSANNPGGSLTLSTTHLTVINGGKGGDC